MNGDVKRIRSNNPEKLAAALDCNKEELIVHPEAEFYSNAKSRNDFVDELMDDSFLYALLINNKLKLAIALIKSTLHPDLPRALIASFLIKSGYAFLIQRKQGVARKFFNKALSLAENKQINTLQFSANIASGLS